jgi:ABC-type phosphate/phosphonate transport system ATPase subunit
MIKLKKKSILKKNLRKYRSQIGLIFETYDLGHETKITPKKTNIKSHEAKLK